MKLWEKAGRPLGTQGHLVLKSSPLYSNHSSGPGERDDCSSCCAAIAKTALQLKLLLHPGLTEVMGCYQIKTGWLLSV